MKLNSGYCHVAFVECCGKDRCVDDISLKLNKQQTTVGFALKEVDGA
jgi:hypothetical protein